MAVFDVEATSAEEIARLLDAREVTCEEVAGAYLSRMAAHNDALNVFLHVDEERTLAQAQSARQRGPQRHRGRPDGLQGPVLHPRRADDGRLARARGLQAALHGDRRAPMRGSGPRRARQDQHGRVRDGLLHRELRLRRDAQPVGQRARARRLQRRLGRRGGRLDGAALARHRHRRLDPPARGALRRRRHEADLRGRLALRRRGLRQLARPGRAVRAHRARLRAGAARDRRPRHLRLDLPGAARADRAARAGGSARPARRRDLARRHRRRRAGRARELRGRARDGARASAPSSSRPASSSRSRRMPWRPTT